MVFAAYSGVAGTVGSYVIAQKIDFGCNWVIL